MISPLLAVIVALGLHAPLLPHTHGAEPAATVAVIAAACSDGGATGHLHRASTRPASQCPACAAGPPSVPALALPPASLGATGDQPAGAATEPHPRDGCPVASRSRAPPSPTLA